MKDESSGKIMTKYAEVQTKSYLYTEQDESCIIKVKGTKKFAKKEVDLKAVCSNLMIKVIETLL